MTRVGGFQLQRGVIPTRLKTDACPLSCCDGSDADWIGDEEAPCGGAGLDDVFEGWPDAVAELVASQIVPDILHRVQLGRVWRYRQQADVAWHCQFPAGLVPSRAVAEHHGMRARGDLGADLRQVDAHGLAVGRRQDDGSTRRPGRAQRAEQVNGVPPVVPHRTARGREPVGAQMYSRLPCWPTRASSWNQISTGLPAAFAGKTSFSRVAKFF